MSETKKEREKVIEKHEREREREMRARECTREKEKERQRKECLRQEEKRLLPRHVARIFEQKFFKDFMRHERERKKSVRKRRQLKETGKGREVL